MINLEHVSKIFESARGRVEVLDKIDFHADKGEFIVLKGPSGSGKTTWLLSIGGMLQPTSGTINVEGRDLYSLNMSERARFRSSQVGFVFQMFYLVPYIDVLENIMLSPGISGSSNKKQKAKELAEKLNLSHRLMHKPSELSSGECQRVALARALIHAPKLLLADEPTGNLDQENSTEVVRIIENFHHEGGTVLFVTHSNIADNIATRICYLKDGKITG